MFVRFTVTWVSTLNVYKSESAFETLAGYPVEPNDPVFSPTLVVISILCHVIIDLNIVRTFCFIDK